MPKCLRCFKDSNVIRNHCCPKCYEDLQILINNKDKVSNDYKRYLK